MGESEDRVEISGSEVTSRLPAFGVSSPDTRSPYHTLPPNHDGDIVAFDEQYAHWRGLLLRTPDELYTLWRELNPDVLAEEFAAWRQALSAETLQEILRDRVPTPSSSQTHNDDPLLHADAYNYLHFTEGTFRVAVYLTEAPGAAAALQYFAAEQKLQVSYSEPNMIVLEGNVEAFSTAFGTEIFLVDGDEQLLRNRDGVLLAPMAVQPFIRAVLGLNQTALLSLKTPPVSAPVRSLADLKRQAGFDAQLKDEGGGALADGAGQTIALLAPVRAEDMLRYCRDNNVPVQVVGDAGFIQFETLPPIAFHRSHIEDAHPTLSQELVDQRCRETLEQLHLLQALAPAARIVVYEMPPTIEGLVNATISAVQDPFNLNDVIVVNHGARPWASSRWEAAETAMWTETLQDASAKPNQPLFILPEARLTDNRLRQGEPLVPVPGSDASAIMRDVAGSVRLPGRQPVHNAGIIVAAAGAAVLRSCQPNETATLSPLERFTGIRAGAIARNRAAQTLGLPLRTILPGAQCG